jgi:NADPH2:quinone reductase
MAFAIKLPHTGAPNVLVYEQIQESEPRAGEAWVEHEAIGVNYLDAMQRKGSVKIPLPGGLGLEAAGRVTAVGTDVFNVRVGDRVVYALGPIGSYATGRIYPAERLIKLPDTISCEEAAAVFFKGLTAQYLITSTYPVNSGTSILLYGAAGAVGQILASWAVHLGATVIGVVSRPDSIDRARTVGCAHVLVWGEDLPEQVDKVTNGRMVDVVYDGIGQKTFDASLASLHKRGMLVSMGASSGQPAPVSLAALNAKSLFLTRPSLVDHIGDIGEYTSRATNLFHAIEQGVVKPAIWEEFPLSAAVEAHVSLERGGSSGAILLKP